jgi:transposase-like protein
VELFERIRRDRRLEPGVSVRELARRYGVHRRTVREALGSASPPERKKPARSRALVLEPAVGWIDAMLREDLQAPRKQRHTIQRIHDRLFARRPPRRAQPQATRTLRALASAASWAI